MACKKLLTLALSIILAGCTARGYQGPERSDDEISVITVVTSGEVTIHDAAIDGSELPIFSDAIEVLPGEHSFSARFTLETRKDCDDGWRFCAVTLQEGRCSGVVRTLEGRRYLVTVKNQYAHVRATVLAKGYMDFSERDDEGNVGHVSCIPLEERIDFERVPKK